MWFGDQPKLVLRSTHLSQAAEMPMLTAVLIRYRRCYFDLAGSFILVTHLHTRLLRALTLISSSMLPCSPVLSIINTQNFSTKSVSLSSTTRST
jgi:hypothetical protein